MAVDTKQYLEELLTEAGVSDDTVKQAVRSVFSNEKVSKRLSDDILRQQDYSRNMDSLKKEKDDLIAKNTKYYQDEAIRASENQKVLDGYAAAVQRYKAEYGELDGNGGKTVITPVQSDFISKKDYEAELQKRDANYIGLLKVGMKLTSQHYHEFKEPLDVDALEKLAVEKNISLEQAYSQMVAPRRTELSKTQLEAQLKAARDEGAREFATKHKIPVDTGTPEFRPLLDRPATGQGGIDDYVPNSGRLSQAGESKLRSSFTEAWDKAGAANTSG